MSEMALRRPTGVSLSFDAPRMRPGEILSEANLRSYREAGVSHIELSLNVSSMEQTYFTKNPELYGEYCIRAGVTPWSFHLPFSGEIDISLPGAQGKESVELDKKYIALAARAGIHVAVVHPSSEPISDGNRASRLKTARGALRELAEYAASLGMRLACEDLPRTCLGRTSADMLALMEKNPLLWVCFDTNHLLMEDNIHFMKEVGNRIITLHVSDYDFVDERHLLPGKGKNDWKAILSELDKIGYEGPFLYEVSGNDAELTHGSFAENHRSLLS